MNYSHSALYPVGPQAGHIYNLWWFLFWLTLIVFVLTMGFLFSGIFRRAQPAGEGNRSVVRGVIAASGLTVLALLAVLVISISTGSILSARPTQDVLSIDVIGHQWWWEVIYEDSVPHNTMTTANEIHVPVGKPVIVKTTSHDVIHSFFIPNLYGKIDSIPDHVNTTWFRADHPGTYRGECAEFCGYQHAHMQMLIIAEPQDKFEAWLKQQRQPAATPNNDQELRGEQVFITSPCVLCHTIRGTDAAGQEGPDLTHLGSRLTLAAATLSNTPGHLGGWITDSQHIKPGNHMPPINIRAEDMQPLLAYLESLK
jgi:cytochrome c oxidase subunit 2